MDVKELITFIKVVQNNSFSKAAEQLGYSQAAVTSQIKQLETELGVRLFDRLGKKIRLTGYGEILYPHAIRVANDIGRASASVRQLGEASGFLRIGTIDSICAVMMPEIIKKYHDRYPHVSVSVTTDTPKVLIDKINRNELDFVYLTDEKIENPQMTKLFEKEEHCVFAAPFGHPLTEGEHTMEEVLAYPIELTESDASYRRVLEYRLHSMGLDIFPIFESNNTDMLLSMMNANDWITFMPEYAFESSALARKVSIIKVRDLDISVWRQIIYHKDKWINREMKLFFDMILEKEGQTDET